jgi:hypothetical protein
MQKGQNGASELFSRKISFLARMRQPTADLLYTVKRPIAPSFHVFMRLAACTCLLLCHLQDLTETPIRPLVSI